ncbi:MAG: hypothetical protein GX088_03245 [Clostridia bacterium]|nr:hypothetical protein [Clostridia bacterium]
MDKNKIRLPGGIVGNSRMLAAVSPEGELLRLFWPHIDFPQNIAQFHTGIIIQHPCSDPELLWFHEDIWQHSQIYLENSNILVTTHYSPELGLKVIQEDFVHPQYDVLVRNFNIENLGDDKFFGSFACYNHMKVNDMQRYNTVLYLKERDAFLHYFNNIYFMLGGSRSPMGFQCGNPKGKDCPLIFIKKGLPAGRTCANGICASAALWDLGYISENRTGNITLFIAAGETREKTAEIFKKIKSKDIKELRSEALQHWENYLKAGRSLSLQSGLINKLFKRSLLVLKLLNDRESGAFIASPEFDPRYEQSGGYGYCWPRDSVFTAWALASAGYGSTAEKFYYFGAEVQRKDGLWSQRYYTTGITAPCWGDQLDETGIMLWGIRQHYLTTKNYDFLLKMWGSVKKAAEGLIGKIDSNTFLPRPSFDIWEDSNGISTYTTATVIAGLKAAFNTAKELKEEKLINTKTEDLKELCQNIKLALDNFMWNEAEEYYMRGLINGLADKTVDSSTLGLLFPFKIVDYEDERAQKIIYTVERHLTDEIVGGIKRYQGDEYIKGNPWILITLWLSICCYLTGSRNKAEKYLMWSVKHRNHLDLFAEQVDKLSGQPAWALPLGWSHAMFVLAVLLMEGGNLVDKD